MRNTSWCALHVINASILVFECIYFDLTGADVDLGLLGEATTDTPCDIVEAYIDTGLEDIGYWELIDIAGIIGILP